jgi:hypothetical protein
MVLDFIGAFLLLLDGLLSDRLGKGSGRIVKWVWFYALLAIIVGSVLVNSVGVLSGHLTLSETVTVFIGAAFLVMAVSVIALVVLVIIAVFQKLASLLRRGTGNENVHPH